MPVPVPASRQEATVSLIRRGQCGQVTWSSKDEIGRELCFNSLEMALGNEEVLPKPLYHRELVWEEVKTAQEKATGET